MFIVSRGTMKKYCVKRSKGVTIKLLYMYFVIEKGHK